MIGTANDVSTLNSLIATTFDSIDGYQEAAEATDRTDLKTLFGTLADERRSAVDAMRDQVREMGGTPEDDGTVLAAAHRRFLDLKSMVTGRDDKAIIDEVERGEDHIKHKFEAAMEDEAVSSGTKAVIGSAYASVKGGHDRIRDMKHAMERTDA